MIKETNPVSQQAHVFLEGEGDRWFERNQRAIADREAQLLYKALGSFKSEIDSILEIGCSNGAKLKQLCHLFEATGCGIEPSARAVEEGNRQLQGMDLKLTVGTASLLPYPDESFDLVYFGFCLYLVDRRDLFKVIAEADRVLRPGGFLAIQDFDPSIRHKRPYHHKEGVFSYKHQYGDLFSASGHYHLVSKESFSLKSDSFHADPNERVALSILFKELESY